MSSITGVSNSVITTPASVPEAPAAAIAAPTVIDSLVVADKDVWGAKLANGRRIDTSDGISTAEGKILVGLFGTNPQDFLKKLLTDSKNGTPVKFEKTFVERHIGKITVTVEANDGKLTATGKFKAFKKASLKS